MTNNQARDPVTGRWVSSCGTMSGTFTTNSPARDSKGRFVSSNSVVQPVCCGNNCHTGSCDDDEGDEQIEIFYGDRLVDKRLDSFYDKYCNSDPGFPHNLVSRELNPLLWNKACQFDINLYDCLRAVEDASSDCYIGSYDMVSPDGENYYLSAETTPFLETELLRFFYNVNLATSSLQLKNQMRSCGIWVSQKEVSDFLRKCADEGVLNVADRDNGYTTYSLAMTLQDAAKHLLRKFYCSNA